VTGQVQMGQPRGRRVLAATVLGSGVALLDTTIVNVALPTIGRELDAEFSGLQWTVNGYILTLASLILLGGAPAVAVAQRAVRCGADHRAAGGGSTPAGRRCRAADARQPRADLHLLPP
jgi:MFS family permease